MFLLAGCVVVYCLRVLPFFKNLLPDWPENALIGGFFVLFVLYCLLEPRGGARRRRRFDERMVQFSAANRAYQREVQRAEQVRREIEELLKAPPLPAGSQELNERLTWLAAVSREIDATSLSSDTRRNFRNLVELCELHISGQQDKASAAAARSLDEMVAPPAAAEKPVKS